MRLIYKDASKGKALSESSSDSSLRKFLRCFSLFMGLIGGVPPAIRAARLPIAAALREM